MRFMGNKESMLGDIEKLLRDKGLLTQSLIFFDAFTGTGSVSNHLKSAYNLIINDNMLWSVLYARGRICADHCSFETLGFDPFTFLNESDKEMEGFIFNNYAPTQTTRMYFTPENAKRIDYFREQIEEWWNEKKMSYDEFGKPHNDMSE